MLRRTILNYLCATGLCTLLFMGCSDRAEEALRLPEPGTMKVLSVESVDRDTAEILLPNGDFHDWYGGLAFPTGFEAPKNSTLSNVVRDPMYGHLDTTGYTARQTWHGADVGEAPGDRFGTTVSLSPHTMYELTVVASASAGMVAQIDAYAVSDSGEVLLLADRIVEVTREEPTHYTGHFQTQEAGTVLLRSQVSPLATVPGAVAWSTWGLRPLSAGADALVSTTSSRFKWAAGTLDRLGKQLEMYGGKDSPGAWPAPALRDFGQRSPAEAPVGSVIVATDQYVFQNSELAYLRDVRDFVHDFSQKNVVYRPAFGALLQLNRFLAEQSVELVLVPLPDRIHLYADKVHQDPGATQRCQPHSWLVYHLLERGVATVDVAPMLEQRRADGNPVYWRAEYAVPSYTLGEIAEYVAPLLQELELTTPRVSYQIDVLERSLEQRALYQLPAEARAQFEPVAQTISQVRDADGERFAPAERSDVLVVGAIAEAYREFGASLPARLSYALGFPVATPADAVEDQEVPAFLMENPDALSDTRVVVFCFPEYALLRSGW